MKKKYLHIIILTGITLSSLSGIGKHVKHNVKNEINNKNIILNLRNYSKDIVSVTKNKYNTNIYENKNTKAIVKSETGEKDITNLSNSDVAVLASFTGGLALFGFIIGLLAGIGLGLSCGDFNFENISKSINKGEKINGNAICNIIIGSSALSVGGAMVGGVFGFLLPYIIITEGTSIPNSEIID